MDLKTAIEKIVDEALAEDAVIVLDLDEKKIKDMANWTEKRQEAHFLLRETTVKQILALLKTDSLDDCLLSDEEMSVLSQKFPEGFTGRVGMMIAKAQLEKLQARFKAEYERGRREERERIVRVNSDGCCPYPYQDCPHVDNNEKFCSDCWTEYLEAQE